MLAKKLKNFLSKPLNEKIYSTRYNLKLLWNFLFPSLPILVRLPFGVWWLAVNDFNNDSIVAGNYEICERLFVEKYLKEGMKVIDVGAHHGFYTLLASKKVGKSGLVVSFEPSPRERKRLLANVKINKCTNVIVESFALSNIKERSTMYIVRGKDTGCNSLRMPVVSEKVEEIEIEATTLDAYIAKKNIVGIDFMKVDAEGAELDIFKGSEKLFSTKPRPIILCEVDKYREKPWGYSDIDLLKFLEHYNYKWYGINPKGFLVNKEEKGSWNLVAVPMECEKEMNILKKI